MAALRESTDKIDLNLKYAFENQVNLKARVLTITGSIDNDCFKLIDIGLTELERYNQKSITIRINSEGGEVTDALAIIGRIKISKCRIIVEAYGACQSAATLILASGDKRRVSPYCLFMHHESSYDVEGRHSHILAEVKEMERQEDLWAKWMSEFSSKSVEFYKETAKYTDKYFTPEELLEFGIVDEII